MTERFEMDVKRIIFEGDNIVILGIEDFKTFPVDNTRLFVRDIEQLQWDRPTISRHRNILIMKEGTACNIDPIDPETASDLDPMNLEYGSMNNIYCGKKPVVRTHL